MVQKKDPVGRSPSAGPDNTRSTAGKRTGASRRREDAEKDRLVRELSKQNGELRRTAEKLETARNRYAELFDLAPIGYFTINAPGRIVEANLMAAQQLGVDRSLLAGSRFSDFLSDEESFSRFSAHRKQVYRSQVMQSCELRLRVRDGSSFDGHLESRAMENVDGKAGCIRIALIDISERKRLEEEREMLVRELQNSLAKISTLKDLLPICSYCKKIRDDDGYWQQVESYISAHSNTLFTHGICPQCYEKAQTELNKPRED